MTRREGTMLSRREWLMRWSNGFGGLALATLMAEANDRLTNPMKVRPPHKGPRAKSVIFLFMDGGPSHVDTFDSKPRLALDRGKPLPFPKAPNAPGSIAELMPSPWAFKKYGPSGADVSALFPHVAECAGDMTIIRSMYGEHSEHTAGNYFMHSGSALQGRPSLGAWVTYGLGSPSKNMPGFLVLDSGMIPPGGVDLFGSGFLPASYQGMLLRNNPQPVADLKPREAAETQRSKLRLLEELDRRAMSRYGDVPEMEAAIVNYELAFRMQTEVPELTDLSGETEATRRLYGLEEKDTAEFGRQCLIARRLVERGVRFIELLSPRRPGTDRWDQHSNIEGGHGVNCKATDKPIAGLLKDLKSRGLLEETLVVWGGEFGRTPMAQKGNRGPGRDHHPYGFTMWMAGGGVKGGLVYGATDEFGYYAVENKVHVHDLHATILHLLGIDHTRLTFHFSGRDMRLTDVHGRVVKELLS
ncbi:MAG: DUF1501 domain-containing protein [Bryobacteraceae bacterium]